MILSPADLRELTKRKRSDGQRLALDAMNIPYRSRHDGTIVVLQSDVSTFSHAAKNEKPRTPKLRLPAA